METSKLRKFAQFARRSLIEQVSAKLKLVLADGSAARREQPQAVAELEKQIKAGSKEQLIERVAYTWFNRFCALRFMDANRFTRIGVVSPALGQFQPEILAEAKAGHIDEGTMPEKNRQKIFALLDGSAPSADPQGEAYRLLIVAACNDWNKAMPFLFEKIADFTELLMPDDLLSGNSILAYTREAMTPDACEDVEVIGWLYQFYISEKKDEVFDGLKKNKKITPENIPAATQLFTPHWIVRYLVENSLGRLWMLNRPNSKLTERMDYYIAPDNQQPATEYLRVSSPEEIRICDPACGSGHMLTYAFDLLYAIYEEEGYESTEIPEKILTRNLYGIEIDERAGELAAFALTMKARSKDRRFFTRSHNGSGNSPATRHSPPVTEPHICVLKNVKFEEGELKSYMDEVGRDLFSAPLQSTLRQFEEADNFGSLIIPEANDVSELRRLLDAKNMGSNLLLYTPHKKVLQALEMADFLSPKYQVVIANPPYMDAKGMTDRSKEFARQYYCQAKSNLFSMFILRILDLVQCGGEIGFMTPISWMSLSSFEDLRNEILSRSTITNFVQPEYNAFWDSAHVAICAFTLHTQLMDGYKGAYINLAGFFGADLQPVKTLEAIKNPSCNYRYRASNRDFIKIPGSPIAYWIKGIENFGERKIGDIFISGGRNKTHNNEKYLRYVWEVEKDNNRWVCYANGGNFRKYSGNELEFIDWSPAARDEYSSHGGLVNSRFWGKEGITWSLITSAITGFRIKYAKQQYSSGSPTIFNKVFSCDYVLLGFLNSPVSNYYLKAITPTVNTTVNDGFALPYLDLEYPRTIAENVDKCILISRQDWDLYETSWDFTSLPLLQSDYRFHPNEEREALQLQGNAQRECQTLEKSYAALSSNWKAITLEMQQLEEENNCIFINAYGLQDELKPTVPLKEITLTCNPYYRYGGDKIKDDLDALLRADTMREFISYAVGCMFGRYSLDKPGLILANQGETLADYLKHIPNPSFPADADNVIPMLDGDWFADDISERFRKFLRVTFGDEHYEENLRFIEEALGKDIQKYFLKDFYGDHVKRYKKRPIYWLFSSPSGSFNALIYMHRYRPDTVSVVLNDYLREFRTKLTARKNHLESVGISASVSPSEKTKALKEIEIIKKRLDELDDYEREILYPLATKQLEIDLDDGVKVNYQKFGPALKKIAGLEEKED